MIVSPNLIIGSSKISNKIDIPNFYNFNHCSTGGGGAHKCCSNILNKNKSISIDKWLKFNNFLNIKISKELLKGVKNEIKRIKNIID